MGNICCLFPGTASVPQLFLQLQGSRAEIVLARTKSSFTTEGRIAIEGRDESQHSGGEAHLHTEAGSSCLHTQEHVTGVLLSHCNPNQTPFKSHMNLQCVWLVSR